MKMFAIRDSKAESFNRPFTSLTRATAIREIESGLLKDPDMLNFAEDFALYEVGSWVPDMGQLTGTTQPIHIININELIPDDNLVLPEPAGPSQAEFPGLQKRG